MPSSHAQRGRVALVFLLLGVAALVAFFLAADPLGLGIGLQRGEETYEPGDLTDLGQSQETDANRSEGVSGLTGRFDLGDLGAVRLRLLEVGDLQPIVGQTLRLLPRSGVGVEAVTGPDGVALFSQLPPGRAYRLEVRVPEHAGQTVQGVKVEPGRTTDLGDILLGRNVVLRGRVIDGSGRPIPGASVAVYSPPQDLLSDGFVSSMANQAVHFPPALEAEQADEDGWFALSSLDPGRYRLEARQSGYATRYEDDIIVAEDRPAKDLTIVLGEGATMTGHVRDETGSPVAGARVVAIRTTARRMPSATLERDVALTDQSGAYALDTLVQGTTYSFGVVAEGYSPVYDMSPTEVALKKMEKDFELARGGTIEGRVVRKEDGAPLASAEVVIAVGRMGPFGGGRGRRGGGGDETDTRAAAVTGRTDAEGRFHFENVLAGPIMTAQVKFPGYVTQSMSMFTGNAWGEIVAGETYEAPLVEMERGGSIQGVVTDRQSGAPIEGAQVSALPRQMPWMAFVNGSPQGRTDASGRFALLGLPPATYGVVVSAEGYAVPDPQGEGTEATVGESGEPAVLNLSLTRAGIIAGTVTDSQGEPVGGARVRARPAPQPRDDAGGGRGGRPGRGGRGGMLSQFLPGGSGADLTDQDGRFLIDGMSAEQRWILTADADDFVRTESDPIDVSPGEVKEVAVVLLGGGTLAGRVVDDRGGFVEDARVQVGTLPSDRTSVGRLSSWEVDRYLDPTVYFTDADGRFVATDLAPGTAVVKIEKEGFVVYYKRNVVIRPDETIESYVASLSRGDVLEGIVKSEDGQPVPGAVVAVTKSANPGQEEEASDAPDEEIEPRLTGRSDTDGKFRIENVPPGAYNVVVWFAPGYQGWAGEQSEGAIRRDVISAAKNVEFRLKVAEAGQGGAFPGRGGRGAPGRGGQSGGR